MDSTHLKEKLSKMKAMLAAKEKKLKIENRLLELKRKLAVKEKKLKKVEQAANSKKHVQNKLYSLRMSNNSQLKELPLTNQSFETRKCVEETSSVMGTIMKGEVTESDSTGPTQIQSCKDVSALAEKTSTLISSQSDNKINEESLTTFGKDCKPILTGDSRIRTTEESNIEYIEELTGDSRIRTTEESNIEYIEELTGDSRIRTTEESNIEYIEELTGDSRIRTTRESNIDYTEELTGGSRIRTTGESNIDYIEELGSRSDENSVPLLSVDSKSPSQSADPLKSPSQSADPLKSPSQSADPLKSFSQSADPLKSLSQSADPLISPSQSAYPLSQIVTELQCERKVNGCNGERHSVSNDSYTPIKRKVSNSGKRLSLHRENKVFFSIQDNLFCSQSQDSNILSPRLSLGDSLHMTHSESTSEEFQSQSKRRVYKRRTELEDQSIQRRKSQRVSQSPRFSTLNNSSQVSDVPQINSGKCLPKCSDGLSQVTPIPKIRRKWKLFPPLPRLVVEQLCFSANFVEFSLPVDDIQSFINQKDAFIDHIDLARQSDLDSSEKSRIFFPPISNHLHIEESEFSLEDEEFKCLMIKKISPKSELDSQYKSDCKPRLEHYSHSLCISESVDPEENDCEDSIDLIPCSLSGTSDVINIPSTTAKTEEFINSDVHEVPYKEKVTKSDHEEQKRRETSLENFTSGKAVIEGIKGDNLLSQHPELGVKEKSLKCGLLSPISTPLNRNISNYRDIKDDQKESSEWKCLPKSTFKVSSPIQFMMSGSIELPYQHIVYVIVMMQSETSVWTSRDEVWTNIYTWHHTQTMNHPRGFCFKNQEKLSFVLLWTDPDKSIDDGNIFTCPLDGVNTKVTSITTGINHSYRTNLLGCGLANGVAVFGGTHQTSGTTYVWKYSHDNADLMPLECVNSQLLSLSAIDGRKNAVVGLTKPASIYLWNVEEGILLTSIELQMADIHGRLEIKAVQEFNGLLYVLLVTADDSNQIGYVGVANPFSGSSKILHKLSSPEKFSYRYSVVEGNALLCWGSDSFVSVNICSGMLEKYAQAPTQSTFLTATAEGLFVAGDPVDKDCDIEVYFFPF